MTKNRKKRRPQTLKKIDNLSFWRKDNVIIKSWVHCNVFQPLHQIGPLESFYFLLTNSFAQKVQSFPRGYGDGLDGANWDSPSHFEYWYYGEGFWP